MELRWKLANHKEMMISIVIPAFNEEDVIFLTLQKVYSISSKLKKESLCSKFEILVIDDGSSDNTVNIVRNFANDVNPTLQPDGSRIEVITLNSNQGQMKAIEVGLKVAEGNCLFTLDADLQDPPELMEDMLKIHLNTGIPCVQAVRKTRDFDSIQKRTCAYLFYKLIKVICKANIIEQAADFRLLASKEAEILTNFPLEKKVFRLLIPLLEIPTATVEFDRQERGAGKSKYRFTDQIVFAWDCIINFNRFRKLDKPVIR